MATAAEDFPPIASATAKNITYGRLLIILGLFLECYDYNWASDRIDSHNSYLDA